MKINYFKLSEEDLFEELRILLKKKYNCEYYDELVISIARRTNFKQYSLNIEYIIAGTKCGELEPKYVFSNNGPKGCGFPTLKECLIDSIQKIKKLKKE